REYKDFDEDAIDGSNSDDGESCTSDSDYDDSDANTCEYSEIADDYDDEKQRQEHGGGHNQIEDDYDDENQHEEHGEEHNQIGHDEILGGHNVLHILSNAEILELLADGGEVILNRALKTCPTFRNLKTLSLGEWCMGADFDPLVTFLQHSPNLERLFLELKLGFPPDHSNVKLEGGCQEGAAPQSSEVQASALIMLEVQHMSCFFRVHWNLNMVT
uniref:FBD domain-containing protein n=1 Tax=Oryza glaberrima TaxID=4538 RepID=I1QGE5_ORYGL